MPHLTRSPISIRPMELQDLPDAQRLQHQEHWNQTIDDWELFLRENPEGCFVAVVREGDDGGQSTSKAPVSGAPVVGTVTSIWYGGKVCWISMLLVDNRRRGQGIGTRLLERVMAANERAGACLRLDATPDGRPVYERFGFRTDYDIERWTARSPICQRSVPDSCRPLGSRGLVPLRAPDHHVFGADRSAVLEHLLRVSPESAWTAETGGLDPAYVLGRRGEHYHHIGPLVAKGDQTAIDLLSAALTAVGDRPAIIDVVAPTQEFGRHLTETGFTMHRRFTRMSRGPRLAEYPGQVVAIVGPEFG